MQRLPLVLDSSGQIEQLPDGDFINLGKLNIGSPQVILVTSPTIVVNSSHVRINATSNQNLTNINGGDINDILIIRGTAGMNNVKVKTSGNIVGKNRTINQASDILVLLNFNGSTWAEIVYRG